jgi:hypothetical protein
MNDINKRKLKEKILKEWNFYKWIYKWIDYFIIRNNKLLILNWYIYLPKKLLIEKWLIINKKINNLKVHWWITFIDNKIVFNWKAISKLKGEPWIFVWFDTWHLYDLIPAFYFQWELTDKIINLNNYTYKDINYVKNEIKKLIDQIKN